MAYIDEETFYQIKAEVVARDIVCQHCGGDQNLVMHKVDPEANGQAIGYVLLCEYCDHVAESEKGRKRFGDKIPVRANFLLARGQRDLLIETARAQNISASEFIRDLLDRELRPAHLRR